MKYRIKVTEHEYHDPWEGLNVYFECRVQMKKWYGWTDVREPITDANKEYALDCAKEVVEYLDRDN